MIQDRRAGVAHLHEGAHHFRHIAVPVVDEGLDEAWQGRRDVAEVHDEYPVGRAELPDSLDDGSEASPPLEPTAHAELHS